ncbi:NAD(P)-dependent dehydrogenase, short-chain alcohol dehydrogenase family [Amycolatopsis marina]|uniref:NAD(P)-dependent dehydrogenase, short-chain alcohol dehydrogenase family n=1 Tax=Amycolatopsis marina TaxID=490629 RepID=A0A1I1C0V3_9PSEU|nr:SDR family NAD(P)-dependent oxidoreductase [Amycolatopsis marina]SFB55752.1 NAD(P)-dependent dehydrogenase, short-chain alcohol dehydrogenase family [Amycolatopsis marina]
MTTHKIALVTGANKGIGFETTRRLAELGWTVWLGSRDPERGAAAARRVADLLPKADVRPLALDVTSDESVGTARKIVDETTGRLDAVVNNAGIGGRFASPEETVSDDALPVYEVNVIGPIRVTAALLPLLRRSADPRLVMVSSGVGSFGVTTDPDRLESTLHALVYPSSKAALNMITSQYAKSLRDIRVHAVDPGYTATDLNGHQGIQTVQEGAEAAVQACVADELPGVFIDRHGAVPW